MADCQDIESQVKRWVERNAANVEVVGAGPDSITLHVASIDLVVSLPPSFSSQPDDKRDGEGDGFFVTAATYEEDSEDMLQRVNERLERLVPGDCTVPDLMATLVGTMRRDGKADDSERPCPMSDVDSTFDPEELSDMSQGGDESDDEAPDLFGYDMATREYVASEKDVHVRKASFLHKLAEEARNQCAEAGLAEQIFPEGTSYAALQWCSVESMPDLLRVKLTWELQGFMEKADALALGLIYEEPLVASLAFPLSLWAHPYLPDTKMLAPEEIKVFQDVPISRRESEKDETARQMDGVQTVSRCWVPELIHRFFRAHARVRSPQLDEDRPILALMSAGVDHARASLLVGHARATSAEAAPLDLNALAQSPRGSASLEEELGAINRAELGCADEKRAVEENMFTLLLEMLGAKLAKAATWCPVCYQPHASPGTRLRPCNNDLCLYRFEELGLGAAVLPEVLDNPDLVELELSMAAVAAASARAEAVFEPFPSFLLEGRENRGRAGWFNVGNKGAAERVAENAQAAAKGSTEKATKMLFQLQEALEAVPPLKDLKGCRNEAALKSALINGWHTLKTPKAKQPADEKTKGESLPAAVRDPKNRAHEMLPYDVVRFVLSSNRLSLRHLAVSSELLPISDTVAQFVVLNANPEREAAFAQMRAQSGSFFAFHGSRAENWYSILRNGLRSMSHTRYMTAGTAHGAGIYLAPNMATSMPYCSFNTVQGWKNGTYKAGFTSLAICEVINGPYGKHNGYCFVVPPENEDCVVIRYLLIHTGQRAPAHGTITNDTLTNSNGSESVVLSTHFRKVTEKVREARLAHQAARHRARKEQAREAAAQKGHEEARHLSAQEAAKRAGSAQGLGTKGVQGSASATQAIQKELAKLMALQCGVKGRSSLPAGGFEILMDDANMYTWRVKLRPSLFEGSPLRTDLQAAERARGAREEVPVLLEVRFPPDFPWQPPFIRVVSPRFAFHTGHVTVGGSICMELLTASGWTPAYALENVLVQIIAEMISGNARLDQSSLQSGREYSEAEAKEAFARVARDHGWKI